jgi:hypothetical protein
MAVMYIVILRKWKQRQLQANPVRKSDLLIELIDDDWKEKLVAC